MNSSGAPKPSLVERIMPVAANALLIAAVLAFYQSAIIPSFNYVQPVTILILWFVASLYLLGSLIYFVFIRPPQSKSKGELTLLFLGKLLTRRGSITQAEKLAVMIVIVKAFFLPMMLNFALGHLRDVIGFMVTFSAADLRSLLTIAEFNSLIFPALLGILLLIDVSYFVYGYTVDHPRFGNAIKSVEPTILGWVAVLACYPPFNSGTGSVLGWYANDLSPFPGETASFVFNIASISLFTIYVWATVSLGAKCSNLTSRGVVMRGAYAWVRHPAYASKNGAWILSVVPLLNPVAYISVIAWAGIYYVRAITEERHLKGTDPDYEIYMKKVKYRFIPGVW